jgi:hypothetical protein
MIVNQLKKAIEEFRAVQSKYSKFGAGDSEPDGVFQRRLQIAFMDGVDKVPVSGDRWELFTASMDCEEAARALHKAAQKAVRIILDARMRDRGKLESFLEDFCWRCGW